MSEVATRDGNWTFDGELIRIVPGRERSVHGLRRALGELSIPVAAIAGVSFQPGRKGGRLRLRLRDGADPFIVATGSQLPDAADPYGLRVPADRGGAAEFLVDEVRNALLLERVPAGPTDRYLLPGPPVPLTASAGDGTVTFDGRTVQLEWGWMAEDHKKSAGAQTIDVADLVGVEWARQAGFANGRLRFRVRGASATLPPEHDPHSIAWGMRKEGGLMPLVAAAVVARLPHPNATTPPDDELAAARGSSGSGSPALGSPTPGPPAPGPPSPGFPPGQSDTGPADASGANAHAGTADGDHADPDALLRRLRELGDLHRDGVLTDDEFATAKQALLRRF